MYYSYKGPKFGFHTHAGWFTITCTSSSRGCYTAFWPPRTSVLTCTQYMHPICIHNFKTEKKIFKEILTFLSARFETEVKS